MKVTASQSELDRLDKEALGNYLQGHSNFKLEKIVLESSETQAEEVTKEPLTGEALFDSLIEGLPDPEERKAYLKTLWREIV